VTNLASDAYGLFGVRRLEFNIDLRANAQVGNAEEAHSTIAQVDTKRVHARMWSENLDGGVDPLPAGAPENWETALENHGLPCAFRLTSAVQKAQITEGQ
jgi:hypothetical protein